MPLWGLLRKRLEGNGHVVRGSVSVELDDDGTDLLGGVLGRALAGGTVRIRLADLDAALRSSAAGRGLVSVVADLTSGPLRNLPAERETVRAGRQVLWASLGRRTSRVRVRLFMRARTRRSCRRWRRRGLSGRWLACRGTRLRRGLCCWRVARCGTTGISTGRGSLLPGGFSGSAPRKRSSTSCWPTCFYPNGLWFFLCRWESWVETIHDHEAWNRGVHGSVEARSSAREHSGVRGQVG
jgi:Protein of unknown function N-terminus (DUF3323)